MKSFPLSKSIVVSYFYFLLAFLWEGTTREREVVMEELGDEWGWGACCEIPKESKNKFPLIWVNNLRVWFLGCHTGHI